MIELRRDALHLSFPEVHPDARLEVEFQRTLRIPDDDCTYPLPPGLGRFPLRHVDDFAERVPAEWLSHGGVLFPMYQSEAMWLRFRSPRGYPFAVKVATGKVSAVTGEGWREGLNRDPQDYVVAPDQPWLDGYVIEKGTIRQFVAMPLGSGYSAEEQITGESEHGGLQLMVFPLKAEAWKRRSRYLRLEEQSFGLACCEAPMVAFGSMGLAPGGRMRQEIYEDHNQLEDWEIQLSSRCFVHLANSMVWRAITGEYPPTVPPTAEEYTQAGLPWFEYYSDQAAVGGTAVLRGLKSVAALAGEKGDIVLPSNEPIMPERVVHLRAGLQAGQVREGAF